MALQRCEKLIIHMAVAATIIPEPAYISV